MTQPAASIELESVIAKLAADKKDMIQNHRTAAEVKVRSLVQFVTWPSGEEENTLYDALTSTQPMKMVGDAERKTHVLVHYDLAQASESSSKAHIRMAGFRLNHLKNGISAVLRNRWNLHQSLAMLPDTEPSDYQNPSMIPQDVYAIYDGGCAGRQSAINSALYDDKRKALKKSDAMITLSMSQPDRLKRVTRDKGAFLDLVERLHLITATPLLVEDRERIHWKDLGTTRGELKFQRFIISIKF